VSGLYLHIPFCAQKCGYCTFYSEPTRVGEVDKFLTALEMELDEGITREPINPNTIFFGGGTPSILTLSQFERLFAKLRSLRLLTAVTEFTIEMNPATVSLDKAHWLREHGVNRVSMGVQSLDETLLDQLGRIHSVEAVHQSFAILRRAGFVNINLDLIFAIPGQTLAVWKKTLAQVLALAPEHLSAYELTYEEGSVMTAQKNAGKLTVADEETVITMYETVMETLAAAGYAQYEISNYARPSYRCAHNLNYWRGGDCLAVGPSAAGYGRGTRYKNVADLGTYAKMLEHGERPLAYSETLPPRQRAGELAAFAIRMNDGLDADWFQAKTGFSLETLWKEEIADLKANGLLESRANHLRLTPRGRLVADTVAEQFVILPVAS
jgi:oxygen-independent coproporphyrinogen-3 oxidase